MTVPPLTCQRAAFSLPSNLHYLNCAYMAPLPRGVRDAGIAGIERKVDPTRILAPDFFSDNEEMRRLFASIISADDPTRIAMMPSVSYGIATVARNTPLARGQNIVVSAEQFPSNMYTWRAAAKKSGATL